VESALATCSDAKKEINKRLSLSLGRKEKFKCCNRTEDQQQDS
jgi:hypothetical protein